MRSLIRLRARDAKTRETREALTAVGERIDTLRLVHEQLYIAGTTDRLRLRPFIMQLVENLCHLHETQSGKVRLDFAIEEADLPPDVAVPLGLILNEFVTNSLKYAFDRRGGAIGVTVERRQGRGSLRITAADLTLEPPAGRRPSRSQATDPPATLPAAARAAAHLRPSKASQ